MSDLIATNIRIPKEDYKLYKSIAFAKGESFSGLVRKALDKCVKNSAIKAKKKRSLWDIEKYAITVGDPHSSQTIDEVVYGYPHGFPEKDEE